MSRITPGIRARVRAMLAAAAAFVGLGGACGSAQPTLSRSEVAGEGPGPSVARAAVRDEVEPPSIRTPSVAVPSSVLDPAPVPAAVEPTPFEGRAQVTVEELLAELDGLAEALEDHPDVRADYEAFLEAFGLVDDDALYEDYVRVKLAFEATRDGGFWHLRWDITNRKPNSEEIWAQWKTVGSALEDDGADSLGATATAECDELSALFAFVVRGLGVDRVGLFWPVWNHVVAVWTVTGPDGRDVRVVVPTSQIFLGARDTLGTDRFDPYRQKTIYTYKRSDVRKSHRLPAGFARFLILQARRHAHRPQSELQRLRNERSARLGGS